MGKKNQKTTKPTRVDISDLARRHGGNPREKLKERKKRRSSLVELFVIHQWHSLNQLRSQAKAKKGCKKRWETVRRHGMPGRDGRSKKIRQRVLRERKRKARRMT